MQVGRGLHAGKQAKSGSEAGRCWQVGSKAQAYKQLGAAQQEGRQGLAGWWVAESCGQVETGRQALR
jgi:hypothetical protein